MKKVLIVLLTVALFSCAGAPKMNKLMLGMTKLQVIDVMGEPDSTAAQAGTEYLKYNLWKDYWDRSPGNYSEPYFVRLVDDKVESYGRMGDFDSTKVPETKQTIDVKIK